jgi:hypothetical protein
MHLHCLSVYVGPSMLNANVGKTFKRSSRLITEHVFAAFVPEVGWSWRWYFFRRVHREAYLCRFYKTRNSCMHTV